ncbi:MAG: TnpV protein [Lachnospiraceae bacterium]|nr:TnpV protein [Lachnospiraceae bacterium]
MDMKPLAKLEYKSGEDGMLYPDLQISADQEYDGRQPRIFGRRWKDYMKEHHPQRLSLLVAEGRINEMICRVDEEAEEKKEKVIQRLLQVQPMPEAEDLLERAAHMEMITRQAEEIILHEVVYQLR